MKKWLHHPLLAPVSALIVSFCWGANFSAAKFALSHFPAFETSALRFALVCVLLAPFALRMPRMKLRDAFWLSLLYITLHFSTMFYAMQHGLSIGSTIIISQMGVPFSCLLAAIIFRDYLGPWRSLGLLIAFAGLLLITGNPDVLASRTAFIIAVFSAFFWAAANIYMKIMKPAHVVQLLFWPSLLALPQLTLISYVMESGQIEALSTAPLNAWLGISYSAMISSIVGYGLWMWLLSHFSVSKIVPYSLLMPVFGLFVGHIFFPEPLGFEHYVGTALTLVGVAIITIRRPKLAAQIEKI